MAKLGEYGDRLESMTAQEVFDVAAEHLMTQLKKSQDDNDPDFCKYDGGEICCAAAPFIKDYKPQMEGKPWGALVEEGGAYPNHLGLIHHLQLIHDSAPVSSWYERLLNLTHREGFNTTKLKRFENV